MLRACVIDFKGSWDDHLPLIEFAYNNSHHSSIQMAPYEALYGRRYRSHVGWFEVDEATLIGPDSVLYAMEKVKLIRDRLKTIQSRQKSYVDVRRRELQFQVDDWFFPECLTYERGIEIWKEREAQSQICRPLKDLEKDWQGDI